MSQLWTQEEIEAAEKCRQAGYTWTQVARMMSDQFHRQYSGDAVRIKLNRLHAASEYSAPDATKREYDDDGVQSSTTILKVVKGHEITPDELLQAHGFDAKSWEVTSATNNYWKQTPEADLYQSKIKVRPVARLTLDEMKAELTKAIMPITYDPIVTRRDRNLVIPLPDLHFGWTTFEDVKHMVKQLQDIIADGGFDTIVFEQLGDLFHSDFIHSTLTVAGTQLDHANMRQAFHDALQFFDELIPLAIECSHHVMLKSVFGNHSGDLEYAFLYALAAKYPQCDVDNDDGNPASDWRTAFMVGHVGIMLAHGDVAKSRLTGLFPTEYKDIWCQAKSTEIHSGHYHSERFADKDGIMWRQLGTPKPVDPYEVKQGFTEGKRLMYAFVYDDTRLRCTYEIR